MTAINHLLHMSQRLGQSLSPQAYLSLSVLQMNNLQLRDHLCDLLLENPALMEVDEPPAAPEGMPPLALFPLDFAPAPPLDTLADYVKSQFDSSLLKDELQLLNAILAQLEPSGYLPKTAEEIARQYDLNPELVQYGIAYIQSLDPIGVGAYDLKQCLCLQLERLGYKDPAYFAIVQSHLEDMAQSRFSAIARALKREPKEVRAMCAHIGALSPKPGAAFGGAPAAYRSPDVYIYEQDGALSIALEQNMLKELKVSEYYERLLNEDCGQDAKEYLSEKLRDAQWLIQAIENRRNTLTSLCAFILARQRGFFERGAPLLPLTLKDAAEALDIHESTVSRALSGKVLQCSRGVFPLKHFFSQRVGGGQAVSRQSAKAQLKALIEGEDKAHPYSDSDLARILSNRNIHLSRRTVAKYRMEMQLGSMSDRRE